MNICKSTVILFIIINFTGISQTGNSWGISLSGFVKTDVFYDSRETVSLREGHFNLYPAKEKVDINGDVINKEAAFNILSIQTRIAGKITAPDVLGAKTSGLIEGAFFGHTEGDINGFRLRHAFVRLDWESTSLLVGQFWHPMFIHESFPEVVSFNTGAPFQPFSRNPQIRIMQRFGGLELIATAASQRDFTSAGPDTKDPKLTVANSSYLRNSGLPIMNFQFKYKYETLLFGAGINYTTLKPRLVTEKNYKVSESVKSTAFNAFAKFSHGDFSIRLEGVYGQNLYDLAMLGGYAVESRDTTTGAAVYTNIKSMSSWIDISYGKEFKVGVFGGFAKNLGADNDFSGPVYARGSDIDRLLRISPRLVYSINKVQFAGEFEYTGAYYGKINSKGKVENAELIANTRVLIAAYLFF